MKNNAFIAFVKTNNEGISEQRTTLAPDLPNVPLLEFINRIYENNDFSYLHQVFEQIHWLDESERDKITDEIKLLLFNSTYDRGIQLLHLLKVGTIKQMKIDEKKIMYNLTHPQLLTAEEEAEWSITGNFKRKKYAMESTLNVEKINGIEKLILLNNESYLSSTEWKYGFTFNLDKNTFEQCIREDGVIRKCI